jgi:hypothetical protein
VKENNQSGAQAPHSKLTWQERAAMAGISDTSHEADRVLTEVYRRMTLAQKWRLLGQMYDDARALHAAGMRMSNPTLTPGEITQDWLRRNLGVDLPVREPARNYSMPNLQDFTEVAQALDRLGLPYALGGSMASSIYGISRHTNDADVMVPPFPGREKELIDALGADYYASEPAIRQAILKRSSFNLINTRTGFKVDVFIPPDDPFERSGMARRRALEVEGGQTIYLLSPEDVLLSKLRWYRLGDEVSEQQWKDVLGLVKTQRPRLDEAYLEHWAGHLRVTDLLDRVFAEATASGGGAP